MNILFRLIAPTLLVALTIPSFAQTLVPAQSEIGFTTTQMGVAVNGRFNRFQAQVAFKPQALESSRVMIAVDIASVSFGVAELEAEVAKPTWFDGKRFAQATFQSSSIRPAGHRRYEVLGRLSIKGSVREIVIPVTMTQTADTTTASGSFVLRRLDFGVGDGEWKDTSMVGNDVRVGFRLGLRGVPPL